jgi:hypothetical protein
MKYSKLISVILVTLGLTSMASAKEEKFEENYKVEGAVRAERVIASEKEATKPSEREPSSIVAPVDVQAVEAPQPWLHKAETSDRGH